MKRACEEERADSQSQDLRAQCEEEGLTEEFKEKGMTEELEEEAEEEEVEALNPGSDRRSSERTDLTLDQKTFLIMQKSLNAKYPDIVKRWSARFTRRPPCSQFQLLLLLTLKRRYLIWLMRRRKIFSMTLKFSEISPD